MNTKPDFGVERALEPPRSIPAAAWKLDNAAAIHASEMRVRVRTVKPEEASFKQLCSECAYDEDRIKEKIFDIIKKRGKLHNPATGSGGIFYGVVDEVGADYEKRALFKPGDEVICLTSLAAVPLRLDRIDSIDFSYGQFACDGSAILSNANPLMHRPVDLATPCTLAAIEEAGSLHSVAQMAAAPDMTRFLILSSDLLSAFLYAAVLRKATRNAYIVAALDKRSVERLSESDIDPVLGAYADKVHILDILAPLKSFDEIYEKEKRLFDFSINCADLMGAEAVSVLLTKRRGIVSFTSFINNHRLALLFAESIGKELNISAFDAYTEDYQQFTVDLLRATKDELARIHGIYEKRSAADRTWRTAAHTTRYRDAGRVGDFVFASERMKNLLDETLNIAKYDCNVLILGETGVGKEKILGLIHNNSERKLNPCVRINCAAIPESLAESEFFGYEAGAFTGSSPGGKRGYFELANNGILFLDEVGLLPAGIQVKLLRVLQENQFFRIGGQKQIEVNVRVVCANNAGLHELVKNGGFREDLYYRLNICEINIPPLRERPDDITVLAAHFLERYNKTYNLQKRFASMSLGALLAYEWPGNVRELENAVHRLVISSKGDQIEEEDVYRALSRNFYGGEDARDDRTFGEEEGGLAQIMTKYERNLIENALKRWKSTRKAASHLGISQSQLMRKKQKYNIRTE
ncbi:MAG: sigma 54-interacting transcriptional regulator [Clostridiales Family XIII bacterium]|jgi:transcriptional regulator with PAS, ATPase and Fis domain|nr:sigma 54-interacting transcriptional regulator [Clostridiales Family XIII bacterium]